MSEKIVQSDIRAILVTVLVFLTIGAGGLLWFTSSTPGASIVSVER